MKNNLIHALLIIIIPAIVVLISTTNARYETVANLSGNARFPIAIMEVSNCNQNENFDIAPNTSGKMQFQVDNSKVNKT